MSSEMSAGIPSPPDLGSVSDSSFRDGNLLQPIKSRSTTQIWVVLRHQYCWFATDVHVGSQEQNFFPPLGIKLISQANWWGKTGTVIPRFTDIRLTL